MLVTPRSTHKILRDNSVRANGYQLTFEIIDILSLATSIILRELQ